MIARQHLALSHQRLGYVDDAKRAYHNALALDPNSAASHFNYGQLLEDIGEAQDAAVAYRNAMRLAPDKHDALANLLGLSRHTDVSAELKQAEELLTKLPSTDRALLGYGIGKALEQGERYTAAFDAYQVANQARKETSAQFNRVTFDARIDGMIKLFSADFFKARKDWGVHSERPVFIVGLPRSGTTLTEQIIASHPHCFGAGELSTLTDLATGTPDRLDEADPAWPKCAPALNQLQIETLGQDYIEQACLRADTDAVRVIDKQPLNFWHLGLVAMALPNAHIIHCKRDIRDCGFSIFSHNFNAQQNWSTSLEDIAHYWRGYQRLMQHWAAVTDLEILDVEYEATVADVTTSAAALLKFLDLPWHDAVLEFHENERAVQTPSRWQVRQPLYKSSVARWQHYGDLLEPLITAENSAHIT